MIVVRLGIRKAQLMAFDTEISFLSVLSPRNEA